MNSYPKLVDDRDPRVIRQKVVEKIRSAGDVFMAGLTDQLGSKHHATTFFRRTKYLKRVGTHTYRAVISLFGEEEIDSPVDVRVNLDPLLWLFDAGSGEEGIVQLRERVYGDPFERFICTTRLTALCRTPTLESNTHIDAYDSQWGSMRRSNSVLIDYLFGSELDDPLRQLAQMYFSGDTKFVGTWEELAKILDTDAYLLMFSLKDQKINRALLSLLGITVAIDGESISIAVDEGAQ